MLLKLAKTLAMMALAVMLLHAMPAFCDEDSQIAAGIGSTKSDGCVAGDACCASGSYVSIAPDFGMGTLVLHSGIVVPDLRKTSYLASGSLDQARLRPDPDLSILGKLNI